MAEEPLIVWGDGLALSNVPILELLLTPILANYTMQRIGVIRPIRVIGGQKLKRELWQIHLMTRNSGLAQIDQFASFAVNHTHDKLKLSDTPESAS